MVTPPSDYLSLDDMFSLVGSELFPSEWTGQESKPVMALPTDYWRPPDTITELLAWSHSSDWLSEDVNRYVDQKAIDRYKNVAAIIWHRCWAGEYFAFLLYPDSGLRGIDTKHMNANSFQEMVFHPRAPHRERPWFRIKAESAKRPGHLREGVSNLESVAEPSEPTKRNARSQKKQEMYNTFFQLVSKYRFRDDGKTRRTRTKIAQEIAGDIAAIDPLTGKAPEWTSVVRRLNKFFPGWAE